MSICARETFRSIVQMVLVGLLNYYPCCTEKLKLTLIKHLPFFLSLYVWPGGRERDDGVKEDRNDAERGKERGWTESDIWSLPGRLLRTARWSVLVSLSNIQKPHT